MSWYSRTFADWYRARIFPVWTGTLGRISSLSRGSVGEILIIIGICYVLFGILLMILLISSAVWEAARSRRRKMPQETGRAGMAWQKRRRRLGKWYLRVFCWILLYIYGTETMNCYVLYHAFTVEEQYYDDSAEYGMEELIYAYTQTAVQANALSGQVRRDADGRAVYDGDAAQLYQSCRQAMQAQGETYPYLSGYYPDPKPIRASHFMSQQRLLGIYFPFTMEANYNTVMYPVNVLATICHEFSHLKGIILEDEANYFGFTACIESGDPYLQYSGHLSILGYLVQQVRKSVPEETRKKMVQVNEQVQKDDVFLTEEQWEQVEKKAVLPTETVNKATDVFLEKNLTLNGVEDGIRSYSRVVRLVVDYYEERKAEK